MFPVPAASGAPLLGINQYTFISAHIYRPQLGASWFRNDYDARLQCPLSRQCWWKGHSLLPHRVSSEIDSPTVFNVILLVQGVLDRDSNTVHLFKRAARTAKATDMAELDLNDPKLPELISEKLYEQLLEDVEMLDGWAVARLLIVRSTFIESPCQKSKWRRTFLLSSSFWFRHPSRDEVAPIDKRL